MVARSEAYEFETAADKRAAVAFLMLIFNAEVDSMEPSSNLAKRIADNGDALVKVPNVELVG